MKRVPVSEIVARQAPAHAVRRGDRFCWTGSFGVSVAVCDARPDEAMPDRVVIDTTRDGRPVSSRLRAGQIVQVLLADVPDVPLPVDPEDLASWSAHLQHREAALRQTAAFVGGLHERCARRSGSQADMLAQVFAAASCYVQAHTFDRATRVLDWASGHPDLSADDRRRLVGRRTRVDDLAHLMADRT